MLYCPVCRKPFFERQETEPTGWVCRECDQSLSDEEAYGTGDPDGTQTEG